MAVVGLKKLGQTNKQVKDLSRPDQSRGPRLRRFVVQPPVA